jgi:hypothetical protein
VDDTTGDVYYFNPTTNETSWDPPPAFSAAAAAAASPGAVAAPLAEVFWHVCIEKHSLDVYFFCDATGETLWERPESTTEEQVVFKTEIALVKGNYTASKPTQLSVTKGEELDIIDNMDDTGAFRKWWTCRNMAGQMGKVPSNFVTNPPVEKVITAEDVMRMQGQKPGAAEADAPPDLTTALANREQITVQLIRGSGGFGMAFASPGGLHVIETVAEDGARSGIQVGDLILKINGEEMTGLTHDAVVNALKCSPPRAIIIVGREADMQAL